MDSYHPASTHTPTSTALHHQLADGEFGDTNANALLPTAGAARAWTMVGLIGLLGIFLAEMLFDLPEDWKLARAVGASICLLVVSTNATKAWRVLGGVHALGGLVVLTAFIVGTIAYKFKAPAIVE